MNAFATVDAIPKHLYVKVGQFQLPFAIKQKDHNILVRHGYGLGPNKRDVGIELGGTAGKVFYTAALFNADTTGSERRTRYNRCPARTDPSGCLRYI